MSCLVPTILPDYFEVVACPIGGDLTLSTDIISVYASGLNALTLTIIRSFHRSCIDIVSEIHPNHCHWAVAVACQRPLLADSVEKVGFGFHGRKVRA